MKKTFKFLLVLLSSFYSIAQGSIYLNEYIDPINSGLFFLNNFDKNKKIEGSPYIKENFLMGNIGASNQNLLFRYNAQEDVMEIKFKGDSIFVLPKNEKISVINFDNKKYVLTKYRNSKGVNTNGYLIQLYKNKFELFKGEKIVIREARPAVSNYDVDRPAKFEKVNDEYYWRVSESIEPIPLNKKKIIEVFPLQKDKLNAYFKQNKVSFTNDKDLINLLVFIESIL